MCLPCHYLERNIKHSEVFIQEDKKKISYISMKSSMTHERVVVQDFVFHVNVYPECMTCPSFISP